MKKLILKILNLIALLLSVAWFARLPDWEPAITSIGLFASLVGQELFPYLSKVNSKDKELAEKFFRVFPSNSRSCNLLRDQDFAVPFDKDSLEELDNFLYSWDTAEYEFLNKKIENQRKTLFSKVKDFRSTLSMNIFPDRVTRGFLTMDFTDYETNPKKIEMRNKLNRMATEVFDLHQELVRKLNRI